MKLKDIKPKIDAYFERTSPDEIIKKFKALGYEFEDLEDNKTKRFMNNSKKKIEKLKNENGYIFVPYLSAREQKSLNKFMVGQTRPSIQGKGLGDFVYYHDYERWYGKVIKGEIILEELTAKEASELITKEQLEAYEDKMELLGKAIKEMKRFIIDLDEIIVYHKLADPILRTALDKMWSARSDFKHLLELEEEKHLEDY